MGNPIKKKIRQRHKNGKPFLEKQQKSFWHRYKIWKPFVENDTFDIDIRHENHIERDIIDTDAFDIFVEFLKMWSQRKSI